MKHITWLSLLAAFILLTAIPASANPAVNRFEVGVALRSITGGPPPKVSAGRLIPLYLVYTNTGSKTLSRLKASFSPGEIISRSKLHFTNARGFYSPHLTASWIFKNVKPGTTKKFVIWLKFPTPVASEPVYTVAVEARGLGTSAFISKLFTLHYRLSAN